MSSSPTGPGPDLFFAGGECLERFGVHVRRTDMDLEAATREEHTRNGPARALGRDGLLRGWEADTPRAEWLNEGDLGLTRNLLRDTRYNFWQIFNGATFELKPGGRVRATDPSPALLSSLSLVASNIFENGPITLTLSTALRKRTGGATVQIRLTHGASAYDVKVNPETGEKQEVGGPDATTVVDRGDGWWSITLTATDTGDTFSVDLYPAAAFPGTFDTDPAATGSNEFEGTQVEVGTVATPLQEKPRGTDRRFASLFLEGGRTNLWTNSQELDNPVWQKTNATVAPDAGTAPDGSLTADTLVENNDLISHSFLRATAALSNDTDSGISVYAKAGGRPEIRIGLVTLSNGFETAWFDLTVGNGRVGSVSAGRATIHELPDGWFRCEFVAPNSNGVTPGVAHFNMGIGGEQPTYQGNGSSGVRFWGMQQELNQPSVSSYIPTGGVTDQRESDLFSAPLVHPPQPMTVLVTWVDRGGFFTTNARIFEIGNGSNPRLLLRASGTGSLTAIHGNLIQPAVIVGVPEIVTGSLCEALTVLYADGSVQIAAVAVDGTDLDRQSPRSDAVGFGAAWSSQAVHILSRGTAQNLYAGTVLALKMHRGVRSLDYMRQL